MIQKVNRMAAGSRTLRKNRSFARPATLQAKPQPRPMPVHQQDPHLAYVEQALSPFWAWRITTH